MIVTTTNTIEGKPIGDYLGVVSGEVIVGANMFRDIFASVRDIVGGRSNAYEEVLERARRDAILEMVGKARSLGGEAIVGCDIDYEVIGKAGSMLMVAISGTAVKLKK